MKNKFSAIFYSLLLLVTVIILLSFNHKKAISIEGFWKIVEVQTVKSDGTVSRVFPVESQAVFTKKHYSFLWTTQVSKNRNWAMSDSLKIDRFNQSIVNAGTFDIKDSVLITKASFAMNPMFVNGEAKFNCSMKRDTLILKGLDVVSSDHIQHPAYKNGAYFVSKLIKN